MSYRHGYLTDDEIRSTFFVVPLFAVSLVFGKTNRARLLAVRRKIERLGGELLVIGWPDGTTMTYESSIAGQPIDLECITEIYKATAAMQRVSAP